MFKEKLSPFILLVLVLCGLMLRTWNVNFDQGINSHPDERWTTCWIAPRMALPASWEEFWDAKRSPLNPLWKPVEQAPEYYSYGHFPLYLGLLTGELLNNLAPLAASVGLPEQTIRVMNRDPQSCGGVAVAGRLVIAVLDTLTIILLYRLGRRIRGVLVGLTAAAFYAFTAQAIQLSHFFAMDPASTTFTVLTVLGGVMMVQERSWRAVLTTGIGAGLAIASKFSALPILAIPVVAGILIIWDAVVQRQRRQEAPNGRVQFFGVMGSLAAIGLAAVTFFLVSPYAVLDWQTFLTATLVRQGEMVRGLVDWPFTRQYRNTIPYLYFIEQQVRWGLWWPLGLLALAGTIYTAGLLVNTLWRMILTLLYRMVSSQQRQLHRPWLSSLHMANLLLWSWVLPYFGVTGAFMAKFNRYMSPLLPFVLLFAAMLIGELWRREGKKRRLTQTLATGLVVIGLGGGLFWSLAYVNGVYNREHTWVQAGRWIFANVSAGSVILAEDWDDPPIDPLPDNREINLKSRGIAISKWSPYEEDTREKYDLLKTRLREADYVYYSSKRIYDSVDELPRRYPMTIRYYQAMWSGELGFEKVLDITSPPTLLGFTFPDQTADESWSLYDHARVTLFRKTRELTDAEFDAIFNRVWEQAVPYDRGDPPPLSKWLEMIGLGSNPESQQRGLLNRIIHIITGETPAPTSTDNAERKSLMLVQPLDQLPIVDNYRWNRPASEKTWLAVAWWWFVVALLGWAAWPVSFIIFRPLRDRGYLLSRTVGWLLAGWLLWLLASIGGAMNTVVNAWLTVALLFLVGLAIAIRQRDEMRRFLQMNWGLLLVSEVLFALAYLFFVYIRMGNPDLWQPWLGGEKFMEFAFLNGILRSPTFPPVDPHFAGGYINYYYFGIYLVAYLTKLTGIYAEVAFNLAIPTLFALTVVNAYAVVYSAIRPIKNGWSYGLITALLGPTLVTLIGNLDGFAQIVRNLAERSNSPFSSPVPGLETLFRAGDGLYVTLATGQNLPPYDFWAPSRVLPPTINEFPYWSFLFADLHPHMIGIPFAILFLALLLALFSEPRFTVARIFLILPVASLLLGTIAVINLWDLPTYGEISILALLIIQFTRYGHIKWLSTMGVLATYFLLAYVLYWPFFDNFTSVIVGGVGLVKEPDPLGLWLLIWGLFIFILVSWLVLATKQLIGDCLSGGNTNKPTGSERWLALFFRQFDRLPRFLYLHRIVVQQPTLSYLGGSTLFLSLTILSITLFAFTNQRVLALCLLSLGLNFLLLWRREPSADPSSLYLALLTVTGWTILAGTQVFYLKDHLQSNNAYRMNTLFKFFNQVWVIWGIAAAIAIPRIWQSFTLSTVQCNAANHPMHRRQLVVWSSGLLLLFAASTAFPIWGTPARLDVRFPGWRPAFGTLNGMDYMQNGAYTWQRDDSSPPVEIQLRYDYAAIQWLLENGQGNAVIVEATETFYYLSGGTRIASFTGLSGLNGLHEREQRYAEQVGEREAKHWEFWSTPDITRTRQLVDELHIDLIYVGQLERYLHPEGVDKIERMVAEKLVVLIYRNDRVEIYQVIGSSS